ncbi:MAG: hypothetical protein DYG98_05850 [Haliscomenobacteraceae bacterium CHB4]|nr:hypothetical protein [Haliscomenobacteraceae bacterium CHB4]
MDGGRWTMDGGRWTVDGGRWTVDGGRWTVDGRRWTVDGLTAQRCTFALVSHTLTLSHDRSHRRGRIHRLLPDKTTQ